MSHAETSEAVSMMNTRLVLRYDEGNPVTLEATGRPQLHIASFEPLVYEQYGAGLFRPRAPYIAGSFALHFMLDAPIDDGEHTAIFFGIEANENAAYGVRVANPKTLNTLAKILGFRDFNFTAAS